LDSTKIEPALAEYLDFLRCPECGGKLHPGDPSDSGDAEASLCCRACDETYPVVRGIPRMLRVSMRAAMVRRGGTGQPESQKAATAESFGYEWTHFSEMVAEYERNFLEYQAPHGPDFFEGKRVLDAGCGSGRHAYYSARFGAEVWAIDLGPAVEVARANTGGGPVRVVQADLYHAPFAPESFDYIYSTGVLHHLPDPEAGFRGLLPFLKPGGEIRVYLYWEPEGQPVKRALLGLTAAVRGLTTRMPYRLVHAASYPAAALAYAAFVWPYRLTRNVPGLRSLAERLPMKQYAGYPFRVCVNDQFDRLSAPIENRYTRAEVEAWFLRAGLEDVHVIPNSGWVGSGKKPLTAGPATQA
jgi:SAM-dependent methyltransferase/uncharacterized protein YbaR (Trm112 family)